MSDSYLIDVGWLFLAAWGAIVIAVCVAAFGRDLFGSRTVLDQAQARHLTKNLDWTTSTHSR